MGERRLASQARMAEPPSHGTLAAVLLSLCWWHGDSTGDFQAAMHTSAGGGITTAKLWWGLRALKSWACPSFTFP